MITKIIVTPYDPNWPLLFEAEAVKIRETLGDNFLAVHHVGSTSVPGLAAKPTIDIIAVVNDPNKTIEALEKVGFQYRGEYNIPMHYGFRKRGSTDVNLHVYESDHPEIELNLLFRDYLRNHPKVREEYAALKHTLLEDSASFEKNNSRFTGYTLGKDSFISKVLKAAKYDRIRITKCTHYAEWDSANKLRQKYFSDPAGIIEQKDHVHYLLYQGVEKIGYAHIQIWPDHRAALRSFVVDEAYRQNGFGSQFLRLCERWLKKEGVYTLHHEARPDTVAFYRKNGYVEMPFEDPSGEPPNAQDIGMGKKL